MKLSYLIAIVLIIALTLCIGISFASEAGLKSRLYAKSGVVTDIDFASDLVTFRDPAGHEWRFEGVEDWQLGDRLATVMDGRGTASIVDDRIVSVRFEANAN